MRKTKTGLSVAACLAASVAITPAAFGQAQVIYDNTANPLGLRTSPQNAEIGDIVNFAPGTGRILTEFAFEYFMTSGTSGDETAQVFLRSVTDGINPDAILYQSAPFSLQSGYKSVVVDALSVGVTESVAW